eukprot:4054730-Amphidinium_carterae.1
MEDFRSNQDVDGAANLGAVERGGPLVAPKLRERPEVWPRVRLPTELPADVLPKPPFEVGPHTCAVEYSDSARCQVCFRQTGK